METNSFFSDIYPSEVYIKHNYISVDNKYISTIIITNYPSFFKSFEIIDALNTLSNSQTTVFLSKQDKIELLKQLTKVIATSKEEMITSHENRIDRDLLLNKVEMAKKLRNEIQVNNQEVYKISIYITINDKELAALKFKQKKVLNFLYTKQIMARPSNFKQKEAYITSIPLCFQDKVLGNIISKYMTTKSIANIFPFYTKSMMQEDGIIIGKHDQEVCIFDIFNKKHSNYNMCILGSSGSGKSYFVKLMILRNLYKGNKQIIFDPEGEYISIAKMFNQTVITPNEYNLMYINESFVKANKQEFLSKKIDIILQQIKHVGSITDIEECIIRKHILKSYYDKSIRNDIKTMYLEFYKDKIYVNKKYLSQDMFPTFTDVENLITNDTNINKKTKQNLIKITKKLNFKSGYSKEREDELIVFNISQVSSVEFKVYMNVFFELLKEMEFDKRIIYIDEIWKCISFGSDEELASKIYNMFKTLRKNNMGIISITQDITDFFTYQDGMFGKSILNNSYNKVIFNLQYIDTKEIKRTINQTDEELNKFKFYEKGEAFMQVGSSKLKINVQASKWEHEIIERKENNENYVDSAR